MAEWLIERGIGEDRALLVEGDEMLAAKLRWAGELHAGEIVTAKLVAKPSGSNRGLAVDGQGHEILLDRLPPGLTEGAPIGVQITRAAIAERGRFKRAQGRAIDTASVPAEPAQESLFPSTEIRRFPAGLWEDVWENASSGQIDFSGGTLLFSVTPAMTVVDVDGQLPPRELALAAVKPLARWLQLFDLGGSIAVDFPSLEAKADRKAADAALDLALHDWPHERTAMNGFGLVQIVARLEGPSLLHRMATSRVGAAARMALRRAEAVEEPGSILLTVHPALKAKLKPEWLAELARRTGREVQVETDPGIAIERSFAQAVPL
ncbi:ribonuclease E/G [Parerythrobacter lacustris]|uniref:Ribonuclease E/G n=1 Tax=Parerythrobacter lacustris TaxID=2969984 RepID=A0ABT1XWH2_9SPHN|nr:ribonuclease E/G [Parerythrobacter lacustris]MCR2835050.1 ribonuclease E/G [Parerythrobacter lacustris]